MGIKDDPKQGNGIPTESHVPSDPLEAQRAKYGKLIDLNGDEYLLPTYTIKDVYDAIPKHCFERNVWKSLSYVVQDVTGAALVFYVFHRFVTEETVPNHYARFALWTLYGFINGLFGLGIWVLGHEAGHHAFSSSKLFDNTMGLILHSSLLVPYFSWRVSHRNHHKSIGNMHTDTSYVPVTRLSYAQRMGKTIETIADYAEDSPIYTFFYLFFHQLFDWPVYMSIMIGFGEKYFEKQVKLGRMKEERNEDGTLVRWYPWSGSHYWPLSPIFKPEDAPLILITDIALIIVLSVLYYLGSTFGFWNMAVWYGVPYLWTNHWLMSLTYLHHSDPSLPHYNPNTWTFTRGAATTIDRDFGIFGGLLFHNIMDTHVLHHHISTIPHYHAMEATHALRKVMGVHYKEDKTGSGIWNFTVNYWKNATSCTWVEPSEGAIGEGKDVLFFRNRIGVGVPPVAMKIKGGE